MDTDLGRHQNAISQTSKPAWTSLETALGKVIMKSRLAGALPQLSSAEFEASVEAWAEIVDGEVPEKDLEPAYIRAMRDKQDGFPLSSNDIVKAHRDICESERASPRLAQNRNLLRGEVCQRCYGCGREQYQDEDGYLVSRLCDHASIR